MQAKKARADIDIAVSEEVAVSGRLQIEALERELRKLDKHRRNLANALSEIRAKRRKIQFNARLPEEQIRLIRKIAQEDGTTVVAVIEKAFDAYIKERLGPEHSRAEVLRDMAEGYFDKSPEHKERLIKRYGITEEELREVTKSRKGRDTAEEKPDPITQGILAAMDAEGEHARRVAGAAARLKKSKSRPPVV